MAPIKTNNPYASYFDFFSKTGKDAVTPEPPPPSGLTATGGIISDYGNYRAHIFSSSGTFTVPTGLSSANIQLVGRNLFFLSKSAEDIDPEAMLGTSIGVQGMSHYAMPTLRSLGLNLTLNF